MTKTDLGKHDMKNLKNKSVMITGAASGIGKSTAIAFAKEGANP